MSESSAGNSRSANTSDALLSGESTSYAGNHSRNGKKKNSNKSQQGSSEKFVGTISGLANLNATYLLRDGDFTEATKHLSEYVAVKGEDAGELRTG
jgi:myosin-crossreactive antigen